MKEKLLPFFQEAMEQVMQSYQDNYLKEQKNEKFEFGKYHQNCKHALSHLEALLKLYEKALLQEGGENISEKDNLEKLISEACQRIEAKS